ncbi:hypothetical protein BKA82DRAFT_4332059 [Pisolithus tinctorius]|nr:hypothetical protein BKA82DRAFT_4332059 [Pisolithus tinctorius]
MLPLSFFDEETLAEDEESYQMGLCAAAMVIAAELGEQLCIDSCHESRFYLCCSQLLPNPCMSTPWQKLYESQDDWAFIMTMGFDVETFGYILTSGFAAAWYHTPIPQNDTNTTGNPWPSCRSLDAAGALGLVLHYLNSTMHEISLQQIFAIIPATVSWYITFGFLILLSTLKNMPEGQIHWPKHDEFDELSQLVAQHHPRLTGALGSIDGLNLPVQTLDDLDIENATFNGWLSEHFRTPDGYYLVADTAFPCELLSYCQTTEWGMHAIQGSFGQLQMPLNIDDDKKRGNLIETCLWLHNVHTVKTVYLQSWQQTNEDQEVWTGFAEMLFSDQIKKDHVSHFHITFKYE